MPANSAPDPRIKSPQELAEIRKYAEDMVREKIRLVSAVTVFDLLDHIAALEDQLGEARQDSERLDWLEGKRFGVIPGMPKEKHDYWSIRTYRIDSDQVAEPTIRAALDEAMKNEPNL